MVGFDFYQSVYEGDVIPDEASFRPLAREATAQLRQYEAKYKVTALGDSLEDDRGKAICAMAEALYRFQAAADGEMIASATVGSVSTTYKMPELDTSPKARARELYRQANLYLRIYRGCAV